jgi:hypothetical protein
MLSHPNCWSKVIWSTEESRADSFIETDLRMMMLHWCTHVGMISCADQRQNTPHLPHDVSFDSCGTLYRSIAQLLLLRDHLDQTQIEIAQDRLCGEWCSWSCLLYPGWWESWTLRDEAGSQTNRLEEGRDGKKIAILCKMSWIMIIVDVLLPLTQKMTANEKGIFEWTDILCPVILNALPSSLTDMTLMKTDVLWSGNSKGNIYRLRCTTRNVLMFQ